jgi:hypothetical protein
MPFPFAILGSKIMSVPLSYAISGIVYDADNATPVSSATITLGTKNTLTAANGSYNLQGLVPGTTGTLTCTKAGYLWPAKTIAAMNQNLATQNFSNLWFAAGGNLSHCIRAYQPKGAIDLATSYVNLVNPGVGDATKVTAAALTVESTGWRGGANAGLNIGTTLPTNWTVGMYVKNTVSRIENFWGAYNNKSSAAGPGSGQLYRYGYGAIGSGGLTYSITDFYAHVCLGDGTHLKGWINGVSDIVYAAGMSPSTSNIYLMCDNYADGVHDPTNNTAYMSAWAMFDIQFSDAHRGILEAALPLL